MVGVAYRITLILLPMFLVSEMSGGAETRNEHPVIRGTLNVVLANQQGFVVMTDSMQTLGDRQLPEPGKKLFKLDEYTVATIAGFGSASVPTAPEFNTAAAGILEKYQRELAKQAEPRPFREKLTALSYLFSFYLQSIANIRDAVELTTPTGSYDLQLMLAGYDSDARPRIGVLYLRTIILAAPTGQPFIESVVERLSEEIVGDGLTYRLGGQFDIGVGIMEDPHAFAEDSAVRRYYESMAADQGRSLTVEEMAALAESLIRHTENRYASVGGPRQVAILREGTVASVKQPEFPDHLVPTPEFTLIAGNRFEEGVGLGVSTEIGLFVKNHFLRIVTNLDGHYFFGNEFVDSQLRYNGGPMRFDGSNRVENSVLVIGPNANQDSDVVRELTSSFDWRAVCYERQSRR